MRHGPGGPKGQKQKTGLRSDQGPRLPGKVDGGGDDGGKWVEMEGVWGSPMGKWRKIGDTEEYCAAVSHFLAEHRVPSRALGEVVAALIPLL